MVKFNNLYDNKNMVEIMSTENIKVFEHQKDLSVGYENSISEYFASKMGVRKRQVLIELNGSEYVISAGAMQWTSGNVSMKADVKGVGSFLGKAIKGAATNESGVKPKYFGSGLLMLEPTYKYILIENVENWGGVVLEDGLFLACDAKVEQKVVARNSLATAVMGGEGLFNLVLNGTGVAVLESPVPREELIEINLENDEVRIDGNYAIAWSKSLDFKLEKSSKGLLGSAVSGEGFVNVYRGTGRILMAPIK